MDGTAVESAFALLLEKVTKLMPYPALITREGERKTIEKNDQCNGGERFPESQQQAVSRGEY